MSDKVRQLAPAIWEEIQKAKKILLHLHPGPDADSAGSALAMMSYLQDLGKDVTLIAGDTQSPKYLSALPGIEKVTPKKFLEVNLADFDLFIILDSGGINQVSKLALINFPEGLSTIVIDHHASNPGFGKINLVDSTYPATAQIVFDLANLWHLPTSPKAAICLYLGLYADTGGFKFPGTSADTLEAASQLARINPNFPGAITNMERQNDPQWVKGIGLALSNIENYFSGHVALALAPFEKLKELGIEPSQVASSDISNLLISVVGWDIGITASERVSKECSLSFRTRDERKYDVAKVATACGGGGHSAAAGAVVKMPFDEAKKFLLQKIKEAYPELGEP